MDSTPELTFGEWIEDLYLSQGLTQQQFADAIGVGQTTVSGWVNQGIIPRRPTCYRIADYFGLSRIDVLLRAGIEPTASERRAQATQPINGFRFGSLPSNEELGRLRRIVLSEYEADTLRRIVERFDQQTDER